MYQLKSFSAGDHAKAEKKANNWMKQMTTKSSLPKEDFRLISSSQLFDGKLYYVTIAYTTIL